MTGYAALFAAPKTIAAPPPEAVPLADALADVSTLARLIDQYDAQQSAPTPAVSASLFYKVKVRAVLGPWLAHALLGQPVPADAAHLYVHEADFGGLYWHGADAAPLSEAAAADALNRLAAQFVDAYSTAGVSKTDAWGSAGLAFADPWMEAKKHGAPPDALLASFEAFKLRLCPDLQASMLAVPAAVAGGVHFRRRKSCCHKYQLPNKSNCTTCSRVPLEAQLAALQL